MSSFNTYSSMNNSFYTLFKSNLSLSTEVIAIIIRNKSLIKLIKSLISILILIRRICFFFVVNSCNFIVVNLSCSCSQNIMSNKSRRFLSHSCTNYLAGFSASALTVNLCTVGARFSSSSIVASIASAKASSSTLRIANFLPQRPTLILVSLV